MMNGATIQTLRRKKAMAGSNDSGRQTVTETG